MKIIMIKGSPHRNGSSNLLADEFIRGAKEAGHTVESFDAAHADIHPCMGCDGCKVSGKCVQKDDMSTLEKALLYTDMLVFVTPIYFYGPSGQMKVLIDRFHCFSAQLKAKKMKSALIISAWRTDSEAMRYMEEYYLGLSRYLKFRDCGMILGYGCGTAEVTGGSRYAREAFRLGKSL